MGDKRKMTMQEVIENELKCVQRDCCRLENECAKCDLVLSKEEIINAYNETLRLEKENAEQEELLNSTLEENKEIYKKMADLDTALEDCTESLMDARIKIKELEKELEQAKKVQVVEHFEAYGQCRDSRRIASLEKENAELKDKLNNLSKVAEVRLANWQKYEKENAELKAINEGYCRSRDRLASIGLPTFMSCKETVNKLKEAKDLIRNLLRVTYGEGWNYSLDVKVKAEQFLGGEK